MINLENIPDDNYQSEDARVQPSEQIPNYNSKDGDANIGGDSNYPVQDSDMSNDDNIPSEIENNDVPE